MVIILYRVNTMSRQIKPFAANKKNITAFVIIFLIVFPLFAAPESTPEMVPYEGDLLQIFFHPVLARPEIAFKGKMKDFFKDWFVTAEEFKKILNEMYMQGYVLTDINDFCKVIYENGQKKLQVQKLMVPKGKKPMIFFIDDLNYYPNMKENGIVHKLVLDEKGEIAAWTDNGNGGELSYDNDIVTILESFIRQYPDFSVFGTRGVIAVTGYEGVFGYQTQEPDAAGYQEEVNKATAIANKLKELGWRFASHGFAHLRMPDISMALFKSDTNRWDKEVRPIVGDTDLYVYPFGAGVENNKEKHDFLCNQGFDMFFGVGPGYAYRTRPGYMFFERRNIDGTYFRYFRNRPDKLFDIDKVMDKKLRDVR